MNPFDPMILTLLLGAPLAGAILITLAPVRDRALNWIALATTLLVFLLTLHLPAHFHYGQPGFQFECNLSWIESPAIRYHVGVDALNLWLVVLTGLLAPVGVVASWKAIASRRRLFYALFLVQQTAILGVLLSLDLMLYYSFWELSLAPMTVLIALFGRREGPKAALRFFLFTFTPSAPLLVALLWLYTQTHSFEYEALRLALAHGLFAAPALFWLSLAFLFAFAVKVPVFPLHGWLADAFAEAPVALAMIIAGKLGLYSLLRFHIGLFPDQARQAAPWILVLAVVGVLYGGCLALVQKDFWRLAAYAALSHLSLILLGIYGLTPEGWGGALYQILSHGVMDGAFLLLLGALYERYQCSQIEEFGGLAQGLPRLASFFVLTALALLGLPLLCSFVGEVQILASTFAEVSRSAAILAALGVILSAAYMLWLVQRIFLGPESERAAATPAADLSAGQTATLCILALLMLVMGVAPAPWTAAMRPSLHPPASVLPQEARR